MAPTKFRKAELVELLEVLGLRNSSKYTKSKLEELISDHLAAKPADFAKDARLEVFDVVKGDDSAETEAETDTEGSTQETAIEKVVEDAEEAVESAIADTRSYLRRLHSRIHSVASGIQGSLSTVLAVNIVLLLVEYASVLHLLWPARLGLRTFTQYRLQVIGKVALTYTVLFVLPELFFAIVVNFTTQGAIRRKKHVYAIDPILFGLIRFFVAAVIYTLTGLPFSGVREMALIAGPSGLTSALVGLYAALIQTP